MYGQNADPDNGSYFGCTSEFPRNIFKNNNNNNTGPSSKKFKLNWSGMKLNSQYFFLKLLRYFLMCHQMGKGSPYGKSSSKSNSIYYFPPPLTFCCSRVPSMNPAFPTECLISISSFSVFSVTQARGPWSHLQIYPLPHSHTEYWQNMSQTHSLLRQYPSLTKKVSITSS